MSGEDALAELTRRANAERAVGPVSYEQNARGVVEQAELFRKILATTDYFDKIVSMQVPCPDYVISVPDPINEGRHLTVAIPLGAIVRELATSEEQAVKLLQCFYTLPQLWLVKEHQRCLENITKYAEATKATAAQPPAS